MTEQEAIENFKGENKILSQYAESKQGLLDEKYLSKVAQL